MEVANPMLESFKESPRIRVTNSSRPPTDLKGKGKPRSAIGLFRLLAFYCGSKFVFQSFGTFDLLAMQVCNPKRSAKPIASIHHTVEYP